MNGAGVEVQNDIATFASLQAFCTPGGYSILKFEAHLGDYLGVPSEIRDLFTIKNTTTLEFRSCRVGEYQSNGKFILCQNSSYGFKLF